MTYFVFFLLAAGKYFHDNNITFLILEAENYLGGRVKNVNWNGESIPLGAGWIHNVEENHILVKKANQYNISYYEDSYKLDNVVFRYFLTNFFWRFSEQIKGLEINHFIFFMKFA